MSDGLRLFSRFAFPPNSLGYCGPEDSKLLGELMTAPPTTAREEIAHVAQAFVGAWPYLSLIASRTNKAPLDHSVVEAYWIGNSLLDFVDVGTWGRSVDERFARRAGSTISAIDEAIDRGGEPNHAFHVFCVYPWVGMLRDGKADPALNVLDRCRIRWGRVVETTASNVTVETRRLAWDGRLLTLGPIVAETVKHSIDPGMMVQRGDLVAMHWEHIATRLTSHQVEQLRWQHDLHLRLINGQARKLEATLSGSGLMGTPSAEERDRVVEPRLRGRINTP